MQQVITAYLTPLVRLTHWFLDSGVVKEVCETLSGERTTIFKPHQWVHVKSFWIKKPVRKILQRRILVPAYCPKLLVLAEKFESSYTWNNPYRSRLFGAFFQLRLSIGDCAKIVFKFARMHHRLRRKCVTLLNAEILLGPDCRTYFKTCISITSILLAGNKALQTTKTVSWLPHCKSGP